MEKWIEDYPLFKECLEALQVQLLPKEEEEKVSISFEQRVPINKWGKVDWEKINKKKYINNIEEIIPSLSDLLNKPVDENVYIEWSSASFPVIRASLNKVIEFFDDVSCVSIEKFIFNLSQGYIIEIKAGDEVIVGLLT